MVEYIPPPPDYKYLIRGLFIGLLIFSAFYLGRNYGLYMVQRDLAPFVCFDKETAAASFVVYDGRYIVNSVDQEAAYLATNFSLKGKPLDMDFRTPLITK